MRSLILTICLFMSSYGYSQMQALNQFVYELRNPETDPRRFRELLETVGEYLAVHVLEELNTKEVTIRTLTNTDATHLIVDELPVLVTILRAGFPLTVGVQKVFPTSEVGFLAMSRDEETLQAKTEYVALPEIQDRTVIITDTMLATGGTLLDAVKLIEQYHPRKIFIISAIAAKQGIERILAHNPTIKIYSAAVDPDLNDKGYIIPGLGDAGDRSYGKKFYTTENSLE